jgi:hypothetical protein
MPVVPSERSTQASTVGVPRESKISLAVARTICTFPIIHLFLKIIIVCPKSGTAYRFSKDRFLKNDVYFVKNTNSPKIKIQNIENNVNFDFFMNDLLEKKNFLEKEQLIFLPYIAWLRKNTNINDFEKLQKLALSSIVRYNNKV